MFDIYNSVESGRAYYSEKNACTTISDFIKLNTDIRSLILCIGTDRYIGDCLGPVTGSLLKKNGLKQPVLGTLENPVHAVNLKKYISHIKSDYPGHTIIAVDACLGEEEYVGSIQAKRGAIYPGKGVGKNLPPIGDIAIIGIVDSSDRDEFLNMHNVRLNLVMKMAEVISEGIYKALK
ncbi:MAG: spore protease YyaC [Bacillota bacterium]